MGQKKEGQGGGKSYGAKGGGVGKSYGASGYGVRIWGHGVRGHKIRIRGQGLRGQSSEGQGLWGQEGRSGVMGSEVLHMGSGYGAKSLEVRVHGVKGHGVTGVKGHLSATCRAWLMS